MNFKRCGVRSEKVQPLLADHQRERAIRTGDGIGTGLDPLKRCNSPGNIEHLSI